MNDRLISLYCGVIIDLCEVPLATKRSEMGRKGTLSRLHVAGVCVREQVLSL